MRRHLVIAAIASGAAFVMPAASHGQFAGKWTMTFGEWKTDDGASVEVRSANRGELAITVKGDSANAVWTAEGSQPPLTLRGKIAGGKLQLQGGREGRVSVDGRESAVMITLEFELSAGSNSLTGVMRINRPQGGRVQRSATGKPAG
jgi:hypothetical protein